MPLPQNRDLEDQKLFVTHVGDCDHIFLLKRHSDVNTGTFWYGVFYIGEPEDANRFYCVIELQGVKSRKTAQIYRTQDPLLWSSKFKANREQFMQLDVEAVKCLLEDNEILSKVFIEMEQSDDEDGQTNDQ